MRQILNVVWIGLMALGLSQCSMQDMDTAALAIYITDAQTGENIVCGAAVTVHRDDTETTILGSEYLGDALCGDGRGHVSADGDPGTYDVTVTHAGYETWQRTGIVVGEGGSDWHGGQVAETVHIEVELEPAP